MNREIKFRAWDNTLCGRMWFWDKENAEFDVQKELRSGAMPLMQYTGLKDKNGVEIFEGDTVVIPDTFTETVDVGVGSVPVAQTPDNHIATVKFAEGEFVFVIEENADVLSKGEYTWRQLKEEVGVEEIEVIGNIYEHGDLLK